MTDEGTQSGPIVSGTVKWFDNAKGFGFIISDEGGPDILLHANVLRNFGQGSVADQSRIKVVIQKTERGIQAQQVLEIEPPESDEMEASTGMLIEIPDGTPFVPARVKWFDKAKGFGFANVFGHPEDVFVHVEVLRRFGFADLQPGEAITMRVVDGPRGKMAGEVRSWDYYRED